LCSSHIFLRASSTREADGADFKLRHGDEGLLAECGDGIVEDVVGCGIVDAVVTLLAVVERAPRPLDRASDPLRDCRRELYEFASRPFQCEAMLVFAACGIWSERGNAEAIFALDGLRLPRAR